MKAIIFDFCSNLGGVSKLYVIPPASLEAITHSYAKKESYLNLISTDDVIEIYCTIDTVLFSEEKSQQSSGGVYNIEISGIIPKANKLNQEQLDKLESGYWLVLFEDNNENIRLSGDEESHLIFNRADNTGKSIAARNQVDFTFSGMQSHSSYFIYKIFTAL